MCRRRRSENIVRNESCGPGQKDNHGASDLSQESISKDRPWAGSFCSIITVRRSTKTKQTQTKSNRPPKTVEQYLAGVPEAARHRLSELRNTIRAAVPPEATEIISYRIPAFKTKRVLVWYAAFSKHCSLFPTASIIEQFKSELKDYSKSKGTLHFPLDKPLPTALIKKVVKARVAQSEGK